MLSKYGSKGGLDARTNVNNVDFNRCDHLAENLPLSAEFRPSWDVSALLKLGFDDFVILNMDTDDYTIQTGYGEMHTPISFGLCARLPYSSVVFDVEENYDELKKVQSIIEHGTDDICDVWKVLSNKDCVRLLLSLYVVDIDASQAAEILGCSYSLASHDLKMLVDAGLVVSEKQGSQKVYSLKNRQVVRDLYLLTSIVNYDHIKGPGE